MKLEGELFTRFLLVNQTFIMCVRAGVHERDSEGMSELRHLLGVLLKVVSLIGLLAVAFGPQNSSTLLRILYSEKWSNTDAPIVLSWYCGYIFLLAINGDSYAFNRHPVFAPAMLHRHS